MRKQKEAIVLKGEEFRRLQLIQIPLLKEFDRVCRENNITYSISGGTLIGAVRHKGYIPWDDDADIMMLREEYEKFKKVRDQLDPSICFFQDHDTDPNYIWGYGKIRRVGTKFIRCGQSHLKFQTGVSIDIFPLDDVPNSTFKRMMLDLKMWKLRKTLWAQVAKYTEKNPFKRLWYKTLALTNPEKVFKKVKKYTDKSRNNNEKEVRVLLFPSIGKMYVKNPMKTRYSMPKSWFTDVVEYEFEDMKIYGTRDYHAALYYQYRDYMTLPPVDKRDPHAPCEEYDFGDC
jgi:lipopolysaccharide cholinephosphotransferase